MKDWITANLGPLGAPKLALNTAQEVFDRLKRLPDIMDKFEANLTTPVKATPLQTGPPWWAWLVLGALASGLTVYFVS